MAISASRVASCGAVLTLLGVIASGPLALIVVNSTHPQPAWQGAEVFVRHFHPIQSLPFFGGFLLVGGFVLIVAGLHAMANKELRAATGAALAFVSAFAAMVCVNYTMQTTFVPELAKHYVAANDPILAAFSMANPSSLAWGLEMWGYALLGVATWLVAPVFGTSAVERAAAWSFVANGPASIIPAVLTAIRPGWVMTAPGIVSFAVWNVLVVAMAALTLVALRKTRQGRAHGGGLAASPA